MSISLSSLGGAPLISVMGEIDHDSCEEVRQALDGTLDTGSPVLFIDLGGVSYIDSGGLSVLFAAGRKVRDTGWIGLVSPNHSVRRLLELVGALADPAFRVFQDRAQAQAAAERGASG